MTTEVKEPILIEKSLEQDQFLLNQYFRQNTQNFSKSVFEGVKEGSKEWLNIQKVIRAAFQNVLDISSNQDKILKSFKLSLISKGDKKEIQTALDQKASVDEIKNLMTHLCQKIDDKVDTSTLNDKLLNYVDKFESEKILENFNKKIKNVQKSFVSTQSMQRITDSLKVLKEEVQSNKNQIIEKVGEDELNHK